jgi:hypothetical protein
VTHKNKHLSATYFPFAVMNINIKVFLSERELKKTSQSQIKQNASGKVHNSLVHRYFQNSFFTISLHTALPSMFCAYGRYKFLSQG